MIKFSVCTAFFNDEKVNVDSLYQSLLKQKIDWEWVVTDDFSENTEVKEYLIDLSKNDNRVRYVEQSHKMQFMRNPAPFAKGEFVFHIDSDDLVYPGYLEMCDKMFTRFPEVGIILAGGQFLSQHGKFRSYGLHRDDAICFLGRCWRRNIEIDFTGIIEENFFTLCNDMFIVKYLSLKTRLLVIPRIFIKYREFVNDDNNYKPFGHRIGLSDDLMQSHERSKNQFLDYYYKNRQPYNGRFPYFESLGKLSTALWPLHDIPDTFKKIRMVGFSLDSWQKILLQDLYFDIEITYGDNLQTDSLNIINSSLEIKIGDEFKVLIHFDSSNTESQITQYKSILRYYSWTIFNGNTWIRRY